MMRSKKEIEKLSSDIHSLVHLNRLKEALIKLSSLMEGIHIADHTLQYENLDQTYRMLLEYTFRSVPDPQRNKIYQSLRVSILELTDLIQQKALSNTGMHVFSLKSVLEKEKEMAKEEAARKLDSLHFDKELARLLHETDVEGEEIDSTVPHISPRLFQLIWLTDKYVDTDLRLLATIRKTDELPWYEKSLAVSALTLSLLNCFDKEKFLVLIDFYNDQQDQVWQRALTGLVIAIYLYGHRIELYPAIKEKLGVCIQEESFFQHIQMVLIQILKAMETEKLTTRFKDEILPDVQKFESMIKEKLDLDNLLANDLIEDKNPDWEKIFEDSPDLLGKIEKMSEMQMEGLDLFMGTFAMLKNFDFFRELSNWFRPFYKENDTAIESIQGDPVQRERFLTGMEESFYMCNSDKYSFCLNVGHLPEEHSKNLMGLFNLEAESLHEISVDDKILHKPERENYIFTQYIQDLYRFFKLHPFRNDFRDIFALDWDIQGSGLFNLLKESPDVLKKAGHFLFEKEHFKEAIHIFEYLATIQNPEQAVIEKLAYCYQLLGDYQNALKYYKKAEIYETNRLWSVKKIIFCYRKLNDNLSALKWCQDALLIAQDDIYLHTIAGNCLLDEKQFNEALDHYFRVEFLSPDNKKILRPISWCCLVLNKLELAQNYSNQVLLDEPSAHDFINAGHIELCLENKSKAMEFYRQSVEGDEISFARFNEILALDTEFLLMNGVNEEELPMISDYLRYN